MQTLAAFFSCSGAAAGPCKPSVGLANSVPLRPPLLRRYPSKRYDFSGVFSPPHQRSAGDMMFTGIIEDLGTVESLQLTGHGAVISVHTSLPISEISIGDSIAVNGACLTVISKAPGRFAMDIRSEEHTSELQSPCNLVCRLLLEKK